MRDPWVTELNKRFPRRQPEPKENKAFVGVIILFILLTVIILAATNCHGQTISPAISECKGPRCRGEITLTNNQIIPMAFWIEAQSVSGDKGKIFYLHLDPSATVKLSSTSARLSPKQSYVSRMKLLAPWCHAS